MVAGLKFWRSGRSDWYVVNPPLVRNLATVAALPFKLRVDWPDYAVAARARPEYFYGRQILQFNGSRLWSALIASRHVSSCWGVLGLVLCGWVAYRAAGLTAGITTELLWCFSPTMIGHGALIVPDVAAATGVLIACLGFAKWRSSSSFESAIVFGIAMAIALLTKNTLIILPPLFVAVWLLSKPRLQVQVPQLLIATWIGLFVINAAYFFHGTFVPLGEYEFVSDYLGTAERPSRELTGNVFRDTALASLPVPLPMDYVLGFDVQRVDFIDKRLQFYLIGQWSREGWWHYLVGLLTKTPLATLALAVWGALSLFREPEPIRNTGFFLTLLSCAMLFVFVSSQTGLNQHSRYIIPTRPCLFLLGGVGVASCRRLWTRRFGYGLVTWVVVACITTYPYCISYFNLAAGGSKRADAWLLHTNIDYGQDLGFVADWARQHPEARPLHLSAYSRRVSPSIYGVRYDSLEITLEPRNGQVMQFDAFEAGCYVVSVMNLRWPGSIYDRALRNRPPDDYIGGAYRVYRIDEAEATELNAKLETQP